MKNTSGQTYANGCCGIAYNSKKDHDSHVIIATYIEEMRGVFFTLSSIRYYLHGSCVKKQKRKTEQYISVQHIVDAVSNKQYQQL